MELRYRSSTPPASRRAPWLAVYFGVWAAIAGMYAVILGIHSLGEGPGAVFETLSYTATSWSVRALVLLPGVWLARRFSFTGGGWLRALLVHLPASVVLGTTKSAVHTWLAATFDYLKDTTFTGYLVGDLPFNILSYFGVVGAVHGVEYYLRYREREAEAARLELHASRLQAELARAQLDALKMQLQPHFLFNTLHSISALIHEDPEAADLMVSRLSDFLRLVLENAGAQEVPLRQELLFLERYMEIQQTRFQHRLRWEARIDAETLDGRVPNLVLQPLVENAIRHGIEPRSAGGAVEVRASRRGDVLEMEVRDDGPGLASGSAGRGVGLANTRARLDRLYGESHSFRVENHPAGGVSVRLSLPFRTAEPSDG